MELKQLEYIVKIAEEKSITRAAEKLFLTQSALNQQLLRLEKDLGVRLFKRTKSDWCRRPCRHKKRMPLHRIHSRKRH